MNPGLNFYSLPLPVAINTFRSMLSQMAGA